MGSSKSWALALCVPSQCPQQQAQVARAQLYLLDQTAPRSSSQPTRQRAEDQVLAIAPAYSHGGRGRKPALPPRPSGHVTNLLAPNRHINSTKVACTVGQRPPGGTLGSVGWVPPPRARTPCHLSPVWLQEAPWAGPEGSCRSAPMTPGPPRAK